MVEVFLIKDIVLEYCNKYSSVKYCVKDNKLYKCIGGFKNYKTKQFIPKKVSQVKFVTYSMSLEVRVLGKGLGLDYFSRKEYR
jgi:hypothetical protein